MNPENSTFVTILKIIGFVLVIIIGVWGAINAVRLAPRIFDSLTGMFRDNTELVLSVSHTSVNSGTSVDVSWEYEPADNGFYYFSYACREGVRLEIPTGSEGQGANLPCATPFTIPANATDSIRVTPISTLDESAQIAFGLVYQNENGERVAEGTATLSVQPATSGTPTTPTTTPPTTGGNGTTTPKVADLKVTVLSVGTTQPGTSSIYPTNSFTTTQSGAIQFDIKNVGTAATGAWYFTVELPTSPAQTYTSDVQRSLNPGDGAIYTLSFGNLQFGNGIVKIHADAGNQVKESNETNNIVQYQVYVHY